MKLRRHQSYTYLTIGSVTLAFHGLDLSAFTVRNGGAMLQGSYAFDQRLEVVPTHAELVERALFALEETTNHYVAAIVERRIMGKK